MTSKKTPLVLAFGHKARQGKDEAAKTIVRERGDRLKIAVVSFADALRREVTDTCEELIRLGEAKDQQDALRFMCRGWGAKYQPNAPVDETYPYGKQRDLLQAIGQGRRDDDPDYWVNLWRQTIEREYPNADVVITPDLRYPNELAMVKQLRGVTVKFTRIGFSGLSAEAAAHISENALNDAIFHHYIEAQDGHVHVLRYKTIQLFDIITKQRGI